LFLQRSGSNSRRADPGGEGHWIQNCVGESKNIGGTVNEDKKKFEINPSGPTRARDSTVSTYSQGFSKKKGLRKTVATEGTHWATKMTTRRKSQNHLQSR